ncbi:hypothetical protein V8G54_026320 [Vigna mungo]|uniref:Pentatricopeptide repeat-containing protein n=1 Tax=Vigna mungo TaxID=3915 RepID=A0AAQ3N069_VIGMU
MQWHKGVPSHLICPFKLTSTMKFFSVVLNSTPNRPSIEHIALFLVQALTIRHRPLLQEVNLLLRKAHCPFLHHYQKFLLRLQYSSVSPYLQFSLSLNPSLRKQPSSTKVAPSVRTNLPSHLGHSLVKAALNVGDLRRAQQLFDNIPQPDPTTCYTLISALTTYGFPHEALRIYASLRARRIKPQNSVFLAVAKASGASGDLLRVKEIHDDSIRCGMISDVFLGNALIHAYGKCRCIEGARQVFDDLVVKDVVSWTSMSSCYVNCGLPRQGLAVFHEMGRNGVKPNSVTVSSILPACSELKDLKSGRAIHGFAMRNGMMENVYVCSALVSMYARCLSVKPARLVFDLMPHRDVVSWNGVLSAYFTNKEYEKGLALFSQMRSKGVKADEATWNAVIGGCMENGKIEEAVEMLRKMQNMGFKPNQITISSFLPACSFLESLRMGKEVQQRFGQPLCPCQILSKKSNSSQENASMRLLALCIHHAVKTISEDLFLIILRIL